MQFLELAARQVPPETVQHCRTNGHSSDLASSGGIGGRQRPMDSCINRFAEGFSPCAFGKRANLPQGAATAFIGVELADILCVLFDEQIEGNLRALRDGLLEDGLGFRVIGVLRKDADALHGSCDVR